MPAAGAQAQATAAYSNGNLRGTYVFRTQGWNRGHSGDAAKGDSLAPLHVVGTLTADGAGNLTGTETVNIIPNTNGTPTAPAGCQDDSATPSAAVCTNTLTGTYAIAGDGTGIWSITKTPVAGSDCRCGGPTSTMFSVVLQGRPRKVSDRVLYATQSTEFAASGEAELRAGQSTRVR